jgi:hypothetical protein
VKYPGVYRIVATADGAAGGAFELEVNVDATVTEIKQDRGPIPGIPDALLLTNFCGGKLRYGTTVSNAVKKKGNACDYTFYSGQPGRVITIRMSPTSGALNPQLILKSPDGTVEKDVLGDIVSYTLKNTGVYSVIAGAARDDATGTYDLTLTCNGKCPP